MLPLFSDYESLAAVQEACTTCIRCPLSAGRRRVVFGAGRSTADLMLIAQGPSFTDDTTGIPYSGPAGEFLDKALAQAGFTRNHVWITNIHKCLATQTDPKTGQARIRAPRKNEVEACRLWLNEEIAWIKPVVLVVIGGVAGKILIRPDFQLSEERGQWQQGPHGLPVLATYQPTYLKRLSQWDRPAAVQGWRDLVADLRAAWERAQKLATSA